MNDNEARMIHSIVFMTVTFTLQSAMSIGTGEKQSIVCDSDGNPYIPATSIAGVLRHSMPKDTAKELFGWISLERNNNAEPKPTRINIGNAEICGKYSLVYREGVQLDKYRTAVDRRKYTLLAVDRRSKFVSHLELEFESEDQEKRLMAALSDVLSRMDEGEITLGHKSTRGLGKVELDCTYKRYSKDNDNLLKSIDHEEGKDEEPFKPERQERTEEPFILIENEIRLRDSLCVREYTLEPPADRGGGSAPSYVQMKSGGKPVIPGMSWAGVFRHGAERVLCNLGLTEAQSKECVDELFGYVIEGKKEAAKSRIRFEDTIFMTYQELLGTRNAINRFSGGAAQGALYKEGTIVPQGDAPCTGKLRILIEQDKGDHKCSDWGTDLIWLLLRELHEGRLHVGGNGSIGRGMFEVKGELKADNYKYEKLAEMIRKKKGGADKHV